MMICGFVIWLCWIVLVASCFGVCFCAFGDFWFAGGVIVLVG